MWKQKSGWVFRLICFFYRRNYSFCFCCLLIAHDFSRNDEYVAGKDTLKSCPIFVDGQLYLCTDTPNVGHVDKKVKIMATKKTKAKVESLRQKKSEINRKMQECQEAMKKLREEMEQLRSQKREINEKISKLNDQLNAQADAIMKTRKSFS